MSLRFFLVGAVDIKIDDDDDDDNDDDDNDEFTRTKLFMLQLSFGSLSLIIPIFLFRRLLRRVGYSQNPTWFVKSRLDTTHVGRVERVARVVTSVSSRAFSNMADDEEAVVLACTSLVLCALDLHQSREQLLEKSELGISTPVLAMATPLNTPRSS